MVRIKRGIKLAIAAGALVVGTAAPALATVVGVGGGTWDYGADATWTWSDYYHGSKCHGSSVQGKNYYTSGDTAAGAWANAGAPAKLSGNQAYWRNSC
ncbi:lactococcin 972 family bacteriocin [Streptomyces sp. NPDC006923]|uniref:lactococcin 972 family bacteriocin n=1 Tax=Streptomyces sp. NPDC006923 TaxID=3155355 RepID=UPI0033D71E4A